MLIVRVLAIIAKPALAGGVLTAAATGGYFAIDNIRGDDATAFQRVQAAGPQLLISEFGRFADRIVAIDPNDVAGSRTEIATIDHADEYGVFATLAPDGGAIAYTALPPDTKQPSPASPAIAGIVDADGDVTLLASDVDLLIAPVWSPDSASIVVRKNVAVEDGAGTFELLLLGRDGSRATLTSWRSASVFPIAFAPDGSKLYFATLNETGSDLYSVAPDGSGETLIAHLSDEIARDWRLSPDGATLAYSVAESGPTPEVVTMTLDLASGAASVAIESDAPRAEFNPAWRDDGELTVAAIKPEGGGGAVGVDSAGATTVLTSNDDSIDLPLAWSPDGASLAVRNVDGASTFEAAESHVDLIAGDGSRERVSEHADVLIVGWLE